MAPLNTRALVLLPALLLASLACDSVGGSDRSATAIAAVSREVPLSNPAGISTSDLAAAPIPRSDGIVVYVKNGKAKDLAWVVLDGQPYACNRETKNLTPAVPYTSEAQWDTWKQTGLDPANTAAFFEIVSAAEARRVAPSASTQGARHSSAQSDGIHEYRAVCAQKNLHDGNEIVLSKWLETREMAKEIGDYHSEFKYRGHSVRIEERVKARPAER